MMLNCAHLCEVIKSFLTERTFRVVKDGAASLTKTIKAGEPHGTVLGPTLYCLFTHDMPNPSTVRREMTTQQYSRGQSTAIPQAV
ncbi:GL18202 [Drosophila persimilis]|uniref:GL18202 n=1 Tax=Drosophila persimilis TaxID=7234 RepID=B4HBB2_DROPE|nr:GL18202 [Drosophila persimilis]